MSSTSSWLAAEVVDLMCRAAVAVALADC